MIISVIGDCDKRPVIYCLLKILQEFGDVLYVSSDSRVLRLAENRQQFGHYQNVMVAYTQDGFDDFFDDCGYTPGDFNAVLLDNVECVEADLVLYVAGMVQSEFELAQLEYIEEYVTLNIFSRSLYDGTTAKRVEAFEAYANLYPMSSKIVSAVVSALSKLNLAPVKTLTKIALREATGSRQK